ncbi:MAG: hypothetical protein EBS89_14435, partial [Proteobacteria bacterium]|nr:hypothetical protein [Pseudomonadota bacterium]
STTNDRRAKPVGGNVTSSAHASWPARASSVNVARPIRPLAPVTATIIAGPFLNSSNQMATPSPPAFGVHGAA